jgi:hypothetical protein
MPHRVRRRRSDPLSRPSRRRTLRRRRPLAASRRPRRQLTALRSSHYPLFGKRPRSVPRPLSWNVLQPGCRKPSGTQRLPAAERPPGARSFVSQRAASQTPPGRHRDGSCQGVAPATMCLRGLEMQPRTGSASAAELGGPRHCPPYGAPRHRGERMSLPLVDPGTLGPPAALGRGPLIRRTPSVDHLGSARSHRGVGSSAPRRTHRPATST